MDLLGFTAFTPLTYRAGGGEGADGEVGSEPELPALVQGHV